jgi:hypothetical protein
VNVYRLLPGETSCCSINVAFVCCVIVFYRICKIDNLVFVGVKIRAKKCARTKSLVCKRDFITASNKDVVIAGVCSLVDVAVWCIKDNVSVSTCCCSDKVTVVSLYYKLFASVINIDSTVFTICRRVGEVQLIVNSLVGDDLISVSSKNFITKTSVGSIIAPTDVGASCSTATFSARIKNYIAILCTKRKVLISNDSEGSCA